MARFYNITGSTGVTTELLTPGDSINIKSILLTNVHATADATVTLFLQDDPVAAAISTFRILSTVAIPSDTSLLLDNESVLSFDNSATGYGLYLTVGSSDTLDVMINR